MKNKKLFLLCLLVTIQENDPPASPVHTQLVSPPAQKKPPTNWDKPIESPAPSVPITHETDFDSTQGLERLKAQILDNGSFISPKKRQQSFQASPLDIQENALEAQRIILKNYSRHPSEPEVLKRVLALHFLRYSKYLGENDCVELLDSLESQYASADNDQNKRSTLFDFGSVTYACARMQSALVDQKIQSANYPALKAQAQNVLKVYAEENP